MSYGYYPGCSLHATAEEYDASTRAICSALDLPLEELDDWNCCGASSGHALSHFLAAALPLRNLVLAEKAGHDTLVVPCAACYNLLRQADALVRTGGEEATDLNREMEAVMGRKYQGRVAVRHILDILSQPEVMARLQARVTRGLQGVPVAAYYGCLLTRPPQVVAFEPNPEQPVSMDNLLRALGATPVRWTAKTDCCGASLAISRPELVETLTDRIVKAARYAGAVAIVAACPLCQSNLDTRQVGAAKMPVFFITELIGLAFGLAEADGWLKKHLTDPEPALRVARGV